MIRFFEEEFRQDADGIRAAVAQVRDITKKDLVLAGAEKDVFRFQDQISCVQQKIAQVRSGLADCKQDTAQIRTAEHHCLKPSGHRGAGCDIKAKGGFAIPHRDVRREQLLERVMLEHLINIFRLIDFKISEQKIIMFGILSITGLHSMVFPKCYRRLTI